MARRESASRCARPPIVAALNELDTQIADLQVRVRADAAALTAATAQEPTAATAKCPENISPSPASMRSASQHRRTYLAAYFVDKITYVASAAEPAGMEGTVNECSPAAPTCR